MKVLVVSGTTSYAILSDKAVALYEERTGNEIDSKLDWSKVDTPPRHDPALISVVMSLGDAATKKGGLRVVSVDGNQYTIDCHDDGEVVVTPHRKWFTVGYREVAEQDSYLRRYGNPHPDVNCLIHDVGERLGCSVEPTESE